MTGRQVCFHSRGVYWTGKYPCLDKGFSRGLFARKPTWGRPSMSFWISMYTHPSFSKGYYVVFFDDLVWYDGQRKANVFISVKGCAEIEMFDIDSEEFC